MAQTQLRDAVIEYSQVDDQLCELNRQVSRLRRTRREKEESIIDMLKLPEFSTYDKLSNSADNSTIKVYRPNQWSRGWTISKYDLHEEIVNYFRETPRDLYDPERLYNSIVVNTNRKLLSESFAIKRVPAPRRVE